MATCPCHDDKCQSLSIGLTPDRILINCFAGCQTEDVLQAIGLKMRDLYLNDTKYNNVITFPRVVACYEYQDETGKVLFRVCRTDPKGFYQQRPDGKGGWINGRGDIKPTLYRLPEVLQAIKAGQPVYISEGEKDVDNLRQLGLTATTSPGGAQGWKKEYANYLKGANLVVLPHNDKAGREYVQQIVRSVQGKAKSIKIIELPGLVEHGDVSDWLAAGGAKKELLEMAAAAPEYKPGKTLKKGRKKKEDTDDEPKPTQSQILISLASDVEFFHTPDGECYATIHVTGHFENWPIKSKNFKRWLTQQFYEIEGKPPGSQALQDALGVFEAQAQFDGPEMEVFTRLAEHDGKIYLDLCNNKWEVVEISPDGWRVVQCSLVKFRRTKGMNPLGTPKPGGSIENLKSFVNISNDADWRLLIAWLVAALRPKGPFPVLVLQGEQGSAKSTTARCLRELVDPSTAPLRTTPREERDLAIIAKNSWTLVFDNLSNMSGWLSDSLCRVATGGGFTTRALYTDDEEAMFNYTRPVIVNGIDEIVVRHDLLDRSIIISLPVIQETDRKDEGKFWQEFNEAKPQILGALLNVVVEGLKNINGVKLEKLPRMADFAKWVTACEPALPWPAGGFVEVYDQKRAEAVELALDSDVIAQGVRTLLEASVNEWEGTASELLAALEEHTPERTRRSRSWPKSGRALSNRIRRAATFLRQVGIEITFTREAGSGKRLIRLRKETSVTTSHNVTDQTNPLLNLTI